MPIRTLVAPGAMADFWPPRPSRFWQAVLGPLYRRYARQNYRLKEIVGAEAAEPWQWFGPADSVLIAPNHAGHPDAYVMMEIGRRLRQQFFFMAAWEIFTLNGGLNGWILQRYGAFSVDREGVDRRSIRQAVELLSTGRRLVVFPEGEIYHLNDRLTPLLEGVAFMALSAQRDLDKAAAGARVWILPTFIRYRYLEDVRPRLDLAMTRLEQRVLLKPMAGAPLNKRIVRFGEMVLTIKEKEKLGRSGEADGNLPKRLNFLMNAILERQETTYLKNAPAADTVPLRVKALRRRLLEAWTDETASADSKRPLADALDDLRLVLRLYSYPGDYLDAEPSQERMAETIDKFEEDIYGGQMPAPKGERRAQVVFGPPIDLKEKMVTGRLRALTADVTAEIERTIQELMAANP